MSESFEITRCFYCKKEKENLIEISINKFSEYLRLKKPEIVKICQECLIKKTKPEFHDQIIKKDF